MALVHWAIEGSNDGRIWTELDRRDTIDLTGDFVVKTYDCQSGQDMAFRRLRLRQTGKNSYYGLNDRLGLSEIEFFGTLHRRASK